MKKLVLLIALMSVFTVKAEENTHKRQQKYVVCSRDSGALFDTTEKVDYCAGVQLNEGCFCGPSHQVKAILEKHDKHASLAHAIHDRRANRDYK